MPISELKIPKSWEEITISQFFFIKEIQEDQRFNILEKDVKILSHLAGVEENYWDVLPISTVKEAMKALDFLETEPKAEIQDYYQVSNTRYKFMKNVSELPVKQFIDLQHFVSDPELRLDNLHLILATVLIPVKISKKGNSSKEKLEEYMETPLMQTAENIFSNMKITDAFGIQLFFCLLWNFSLAITKVYLDEKMKNQLKLTLKTLKKEKLTEEQKKIVEQIDREIGSLENING